MARLAIVVGFVLAFGCSVIVPSELGTIHCSSEGAIGPPACDPGMICRFGECVPQASTGGSGGGSGAGGGSGGSGGGSGAGGGTGGTAPKVGTTCKTDADCNDGSGDLICATNPGLLGIPAGTGLCTRGCCTSSDCGAGNVCAVTLRGNNLCFVASAVGRPAPGSISAGYACAANPDCRSALCVGGLCVDACCTNTNCGGQLPHCTMRNVPGGDPREHFYCGKAGILGLDEPCYSSAECQSNYCLASTGRCTIRCCKKSECEAAGANWECYYIDQPDYAGPRCGPQGATGSKPLGVACGGDFECQSGKCLDVGAGYVCTDACCRNEDCGNTSELGCRPVEIEGTGVLLCVAI